MLCCLEGYQNGKVTQRSCIHIFIEKERSVEVEQYF